MNVLFPRHSPIYTFSLLHTRQKPRFQDPEAVINVSLNPFAIQFCVSAIHRTFDTTNRIEITFPILNSVLVIDLTGLWIIFSQQRSSLWIELHKWNIFDFSSFSYILSFDIAFRFLTLSLRVASPPRHFRWTSRCAKTVHRARERSPHRKASCSDGVFRRKNFPQNRVFITF